MTIGTVHVYEIGMSAPDIVYLEVRDQEIARGTLLQLSSPDSSALNAFVQRDPVTGGAGTSWCRVVGQVNGTQKMWLRFSDEIPTAFLDRPTVDNSANWATIGGRTVTAVSRLTMPFDQGYCISSTMQPGRIGTMKHFIRLKLDGNLSPGAYTVSCATNPFPATSFTFDPKSSRCISIRATQTGHRYKDPEKRAYLSDWAPGFPSEGAIDFLGTYGLSAFNIIDSNGWVHFTGPITQRWWPAQIEPYLNTNSKFGPVVASGGTGYAVNDILTLTGGTGTAPTVKVKTVSSGVITAATWVTLGEWTVAPNDPVSTTGGTGSGATFNSSLFTIASTTNAPKTVETLTVGSPTSFKITGHGYTTGQIKNFRGFSGTISGSLEGLNLVVTVTDADNFTVAVDTTGKVWSSTDRLTGYNGLVYDTFQSNHAATHIFEMDYSGWQANKFGTYYVQIPGLGISDPFTVDDAIHYQNAATHIKGYYNQLWGRALDSSFGGYSRPTNYKDGNNGVIIYESNLPAPFSDQLDGAAPTTSGTNGAISPFVTTTEVTDWYGGWSDAGDWDMYIGAHAYALHDLLTLGYEILPAASRATNFGFPRSSASLGSTYNGTDALPDVIHMVLWYVDVLRRTQKVDGGVYGGMEYGGTDGGGSDTSPSQNSVLQGYVHNPDHASNYAYTAIAAAIASFFYGAGFTTLGDLWKNSAVLAWTWAENLYQDYATNGATGTQIQNYYVTTLNMKSNFGWTDPQFATAMANLQTFANGGPGFGCNPRQFAAAALYRATGDSSYISGMTFGYNYDGWEIFLNSGASALHAAVLSSFNAEMVSSSIGINTPALNGQIPYKRITASNFFTTSGNGSGGSNDFIRLRHMESDTTKQATYLAMLMAHDDWKNGANQMGICCTTGLGTRSPRNHLHRDREAMGLLTLPGYTLYMWWWNLSPGIFVFNLGGETTSAYTWVLPNTSTNGLVTYNFQIPPMWQFWDNTYFVDCTEFTTEQNIVTSYVLSLFRHAYDGNTNITLQPELITSGYAL